MAHEARGLGKPGLKFVLLCNHSGGLSQFRLASVSLLVQWAGKVSTEPLPGPWVRGETDLLSAVNLAPHLLRQIPFYFMFSLKINTLFFIFTLGWCRTVRQGGLPRWAVPKGTSAPNPPPNAWNASQACWHAWHDLPWPSGGGGWMVPHGRASGLGLRWGCLPGPRLGARSLGAGGRPSVPQGSPLSGQQR